MEAEKYYVVEALLDSRRLKIRAQRPDDKDGLLAAVCRSSGQSRYSRFFSPKLGFTEKEIAYFVDVDFVNHVALVAELEEGDQSMIIGGARYVVVQPGKAEVAFIVVDQYQGQGVGASLMHHLSTIARGGGLKVLVAAVLADNISMLKVFQKSGLRLSTLPGDGVIHVTLQLD